MFKFLKEKLKSWLGSSEEKADKKLAKAKTEKKPAKKKEKLNKKEKKHKEKKFQEIKKEREISKQIIQDIQQEGLEIKGKEARVEEIIAEKQEKPGFFSKLFGRFKFKISEDYFQEIFSELEFSLLENNVAFEVVEKIKEDLKKELIGLEIKKEDVQAKIKLALKNSIEKLLLEPFDLIEKIKAKQGTFVIVFFGINGSGKTTTIAKIANLLKKNNISCLLAAGDTFRAASIEQLAEHANKLKVEIIKSKYQSDPASVAFDAIKHAQANNIKVVLIDTAGRMHTKENLMKEMEKIIRISKPDMKIFIAESITGNDAIEQAKTFNQAVGIDAIILSKADVDDKSGTILSISYVTGKPILYLGVGQSYNDLQVFNKKKVLDDLGL